MNRVIVTGDIHNEFNRLNAFLNKEKPDICFCCGDFGYWPKFAKKAAYHVRPLSDIKLQETKEIRWCDGNHEDHWSLKVRDSDEIEPGIIYQPRGSVYTLEDGRNVMFFGGADSIDKNLRVLGQDWFPDEIITQKDLYNLPEIKIDIMITHTCPAELVPIVLLKYPDKKLEPSNHALSTLWKWYKPELWFFGHWHQYLDLYVDGTQFYGLSAIGFGERWWMPIPEKI